MEDADKQTKWPTTEPPAERPDDAHLKQEINNLLWDNLPDSTTLGKADTIACRIFEEIWDLWENASPVS